MFFYLFDLFIIKIVSDFLLRFKFYFVFGISRIYLRGMRGCEGIWEVDLLGFVGLVDYLYGSFF